MILPFDSRGRLTPKVQKQSIPAAAIQLLLKPKQPLVKVKNEGKRN